MKELPYIVGWGIGYLIVINITKQEASLEDMLFSFCVTMLGCLIIDKYFETKSKAK